MEQSTLAELEHDTKKRRTRREVFLEKMFAETRVVQTFPNRREAGEGPSHALRGCEALRGEGERPSASGDAGLRDCAGGDEEIRK